MLATVTKLDKTESGWPMVTLLDTEGRNHWLFNRLDLKVGEKVIIDFIQKGPAFYEWEIAGRPHGQG